MFRDIFVLLCTAAIGQASLVPLSLVIPSSPGLSPPPFSPLTPPPPRPTLPSNSELHETLAHADSAKNISQMTGAGSHAMAGRSLRTIDGRVHRQSKIADLRTVDVHRRISKALRSPGCRVVRSVRRTASGLNNMLALVGVADKAVRIAILFRSARGRVVAYRIAVADGGLESAAQLLRLVVCLDPRPPPCPRVLPDSPLSPTESYTPAAAPLTDAVVPLAPDDYSTRMRFQVWLDSQGEGVASFNGQNYKVREFSLPLAIQSVAPTRLSEIITGLLLRRFAIPILTYQLYCGVSRAYMLGAFDGENCQVAILVQNEECIKPATLKMAILSGGGLESVANDLLHSLHRMIA